MSLNNELVPVKRNSSKSSNWKERVQFRKKNKWLTYSSQIARRVLAAIDDRPDLNQAKLAIEIDVSSQYISKIVKGQENLTLETIYKLSEALGTALITFPPYKYNTKLLGKDFYSTGFQIQGSISITTTVNISSFNQDIPLPMEHFKNVLSLVTPKAMSDLVVYPIDKV